MPFFEIIVIACLAHVLKASQKFGFVYRNNAWNDKILPYHSDYSFVGLRNNPILNQQSL